MIPARDSWLFGHLIRLMRKLDLTKKTDLLHRTHPVPVPPTYLLCLENTKRASSCNISDELIKMYHCFLQKCISQAYCICYVYFYKSIPSSIALRVFFLRNWGPGLGQREIPNVRWVASIIFRLCWSPKNLTRCPLNLKLVWCEIIQGLSSCAKLLGGIFAICPLLTGQIQLVFHS